MPPRCMAEIYTDVAQERPKQEPVASAARVRLDVRFDLRRGSSALLRLRTYLDARLATGRPLPTSLLGDSQGSDLFPVHAAGLTR